MTASRETSQTQRFAARRRAAFQSALKLDKVDAVLVSKPSDVRWLSGLVEGSQNLLIARNWAHLLTHPMYRDQIPVECPGLEFTICEKDLQADLKALLKKRRVRRLGVQKNFLTLETFELLRKKQRGVRLLPLDEYVKHARAIKDEEEISLTRKAVRIAEQGFSEMLAGGAAALIGKTERQIATELEVRMRELGALRQGFPGGLIVASGPNSASCHHIPTNRKVREGDVVLIDWGAEADGYRSDQTRTLYMRRVVSPLEKVHPIVQEAYQRAADAVRPRQTCKGMDKAAREYIKKEGYGKEFKHGLGHGVGLDIHESPFLGRNDINLRKNMIITIEPGIYFAGIGGVRLENMVLVTATGGRIMNRLPLDLESSILK